MRAYSVNHFRPEAASRGVLYKKMFLKFLQNLQENICSRVSFLIKFQAVNFLWILQNFEKRFNRKPQSDCFNPSEIAILITKELLIKSPMLIIYNDFSAIKKVKQDISTVQN